MAAGRLFLSILMALSIAFGSFTKSTGVAPAAQSFAHGLGSTPKALIMWMAGGLTTDTFVTSYYKAIGFTTATTQAFSHAGASVDAGASSNSSGRFAAKVLTIVEWAEATLAEADLSSFDATNVNLSWTTNNAVAYVIHFCVIGGDDLTNAIAINWDSPSVTGNKSVTGVGFQPNILFHLTIPFGAVTPPTTQADSRIGLGVMTAGGEWVSWVRSDDNATTTDTYRIQLTNAGIVHLTGAGAVGTQASWVSMDSDGFTVNYTTASGGDIITLALKGGSYKTGSSNKPTGAAPVTQTFTTTFTPKGYLLSSFQDTTQAGSVAHNRWGLGGSDGTSEQSSAISDTDNLADSSVDAIDSTTKVFIKDNNNTPAIDAEADHSSLGATGPVINWTTNDAVATEMLYVAFGDTIELWAQSVM